MKAAEPMMWKPSTRDLETIADMANARMPLVSIARDLGQPEGDFRAWVASLTATHALDAASIERLLFPAPPPPPWHLEPTTPKIVADRVFEAAGEGEDAHSDGLEEMSRRRDVLLALVAQGAQASASCPGCDLVLGLPLLGLL